VAQFLVSWLLVGGRFRISAINGSGRRKGRIIEVEVIAAGERFHGSARRCARSKAQVMTGAMIRPRRLT
jgi:hypothetical protein